MPDLLNHSGGRRARLHELLAGGEPVVAPGAHDVLSARLVEQAGFDAVYMTGFGATASLLGRPDVGLLTQTEMVDHAERLAAAVDVPLIADADTGYGNPINVIRTVQEYERAGVAALHIEDQVSPKRCGHLAGKEVIAAEDMVAKVRAAVDARTDPGLVIIARTDVVEAQGIEAAIDRARRYADAGADVLFVEAPRTEADVERVADALSDQTLLFNGLEGGRSPALPIDRLRELGFALVLFPVTTLLAATAGMRRALERVRIEGTPSAMLDEFGGIDEFTELVGIEEFRSLESAYESGTS